MISPMGLSGLGALEVGLRCAAPSWPTFPLSQIKLIETIYRLATVIRIQPFKSGRVLPWLRPIGIAVIIFSFVAFGTLWENAYERSNFPPPTKPQPHPHEIQSFLLRDSCLKDL